MCELLLQAGPRACGLPTLPGGTDALLVPPQSLCLLPEHVPRQCWRLMAVSWPQMFGNIVERDLAVSLLRDEMLSSKVWPQRASSLGRRGSTRERGWEGKMPTPPPLSDDLLAATHSSELMWW